MENNSILILDSYLASLNLDEAIFVQEAINLSLTTPPEKIKKFMSKALVTAKNALREFGISPSKAQQVGKKIGRIVKKYYDQGKTPQEASKAVTGMFFKFTQDTVEDAIRRHKDKGGPMSLEETIIRSVMLFFMILAVNTAIFTITANAMGVADALFLTVGIFGPMIEEAVKTWFVHRGMPYVGTGIVFGMELVMYVTRFIHAGVSIPRVLLARAIGLMIHFATVFIQKYIVDKSTPKNRGKYLFAAWVAGCFVHISWNMTALIAGGVLK